MRKQIIIRVPRAEYNKINDMLVGMAQSLSDKTLFKKDVKPPRTSSAIITYAFRELEAEDSLRNSDAIKRQKWGRAKLPSWLATNTGVPLTSFSMEIDANGYQKMMAWIKELYPDVYDNNKISNNDFIGALGVAYAHRIMAGTIPIEVTIPRK
ncbi:hypothetical protein [Lactobacillus bombicola]|uniref:Uncharacterized protein n=1 Tax=Lactobacillus bombicola TaxID=1505723 RepID=A0A396SUH1_9LACO|nr:hypothetical protein [Lactobacillus bombicola]RHW49244.1 hypothetical protein DS834_07885 [Lactobacillus bombicola]RHW55084.1 hypothetical protein DS835_01535 [Lactobacillus bombicola]